MLIQGEGLILNCGGKVYSKHHINTVHYYNTQLKTAHSIIKLQNGVHVFWLTEESLALTCLGCPSDSSYESKLFWLTESSELQYSLANQSAYYIS